ncbi:MAG: hypothetical protein ISS02_01320 [Candidatus Portnoybacteria bacterium]|nr:hypothetical protein [Candidatus Portnoybacteria bacterium]
MIKKIFSILILLFIFVLPVLASSIQEMEIGEQIEVKGVVIVEPKILGAQIFYINGAQIYSYYKDWPELKLGDQIIVKGVISKSRGENRIKIKTKDDIKVINHNLSTNPKQVKIGDINDSLVGHLIRINGLVIEITGSKIFIDENQKEVIVYIKEGTRIKKTGINEGQEIEVIGILSRSNDYLRLLPRSQQDINLLEDSLEVDIPVEMTSILEPESLTREVARKNFYDLRHYFIFSSIILGIFFLILVIVRFKHLK